LRSYRSAGESPDEVSPNGVSVRRSLDGALLLGQGAVVAPPSPASSGAEGRSSKSAGGCLRGRVSSLAGGGMRSSLASRERGERVRWADSVEDAEESLERARGGGRREAASPSPSPSASVTPPPSLTPPPSVRAREAAGGFGVQRQSEGSGGVQEKSGGIPNRMLAMAMMAEFSQKEEPVVSDESSWGLPIPRTARTAECVPSPKEGIPPPHRSSPQEGTPLPHRSSPKEGMPLPRAAAPRDPANFTARSLSKELGAPRDTRKAAPLRVSPKGKTVPVSADEKRDGVRARGGEGVPRRGLPASPPRVSVPPVVASGGMSGGAVQGESEGVYPGVAAVPVAAERAEGYDHSWDLLPRPGGRKSPALHPAAGDAIPSGARPGRAPGPELGARGGQELGARGRGGAAGVSSAGLRSGAGGDKSVRQAGGAAVRRGAEDARGGGGRAGAGVAAVRGGKRPPSGGMWGAAGRGEAEGVDAVVGGEAVQRRSASGGGSGTSVGEGGRPVESGRSRVRLEEGAAAVEVGRSRVRLQDGGVDLET